jgi:hypothetical protein
MDCASVIETADEMGWIRTARDFNDVLEKEKSLQNLLGGPISRNDVFSSSSCLEPKTLAELIDAGSSEFARRSETASLMAKIRILADSESYATACVMSLLPNVKSLCIFWYHNLVYYVDDRVDPQARRMWTI